MNRNRWLVVAVAMVLSLAAFACDDGDDTAAPTATPTAVAVGLTPLPPTLPPGTALPSETPEPGLPATIELAAEPQALLCDGTNASKVTARVLDVNGEPVADGTEVRFNVVALATADPIDTTTTSGIAESSVVALGSQVGVVVNVTAGEIQQGIRIDCQ
ncbi:MAG TPA: hypothetical protein VJP07_04250 [Dehalococcoidia bacterium]|nr:hypothetical protein [Dehalococcoidia bacterium]